MIGAFAIVAMMSAAETAPEDCIVRPGAPAAASATYNGKTYAFTSAECREVFLSDPERYSQLYEALAELLAAGAAVEAPEDVSLVPS